MQRSLCRGTRRAGGRMPPLPLPTPRPPETDSPPPERGHKGAQRTLTAAAAMPSGPPARGAPYLAPAGSALSG